MKIERRFQVVHRELNYGLPMYERVALEIEGVVGLVQIDGGWEGVGDLYAAAQAGFGTMTLEFRAPIELRRTPGRTLEHVRR